MNYPIEKPKLTDTGLGFSVFYKEKYLYSKRDPQKSILNLIENTEIKEGTLILCISPVLGYGLKELLQKMPNNTLALAVEADDNLAEISKNQIDKNIFNSDKIAYINSNSIPDFLKKAEPFIKEKKLRRILCLDFSAGAYFYDDFYKKIEIFTQDYISRHWINRLTLIRFGRNYARNIFKNYRRIEKTYKNINFLQKNYIDKPILVLGAGTSLDIAGDFIIKNRSNLFILSCDAVCCGLYPEIIPDAAVILESQYWIQKAFIGLAGSGIPIFADLTANPKAVFCTEGSISFFFTEYFSHPFFDKMQEQNILPLQFEPMGSVGLSALSIAKKIALADVPVFHTGLDFSWKNGFTHSKFGFQTVSAFSENTKLQPLYNPQVIFPEKLQKLKGKKDKQEFCFSSPALKNYGDIYKNAFSHVNNLFDLGTEGLCIGSVQKTFEEAEQIIKHYIQNKSSAPKYKEDANLNIEGISSFLSCEKNKLTELKDIFTGKKIAEDNYTKKLIKSAPYLYFHFPDYDKINITDSNFLNRLRIEIEYFLKILS